ncbi:MAG TPA: DUF1848 domain-containing protein, partial [Firmicutes bacterium]|nr:DUF1848 domain-containing protein [Bacillota bacterium]
MIISVSRRTDIPAFFSDWFMAQVRAGYCFVPNPMRPSQVSKVSLLPEDVECMVFWSKSPAPLLRHLPELDARGFKYYFLFTLNGYPRILEPYLPDTSMLINSFVELAQTIGPAKVIWRYDPIIISAATPYQYHVQHFAYLAQELRGSTERVVVSIFDWYPFLKNRLQKPPYEALHIESEPERDEQ